MTRAYTLSEIDQMREYVTTLLFGPLRWHGAAAARDLEIQRPQIEDRLRTYLMSGIEPEELRRAAIVAADEWHRRNDSAFVRQAS